jgi:hypothetical protein
VLERAGVLALKKTGINGRQKKEANCSYATSFGKHRRIRIPLD